jgi:hypothetical protein
LQLSSQVAVTNHRQPCVRHARQNEGCSVHEDVKSLLRPQDAEAPGDRTPGGERSEVRVGLKRVFARNRAAVHYMDGIWGDDAMLERETALLVGDTDERVGGRAQRELDAGGEGATAGGAPAHERQAVRRVDDRHSGKSRGKAPQRPCLRGMGVHEVAAPSAQEAHESSQGVSLA